MPRKRKQHMVKVSTSEDILGNIQSSSKRDIWCSQTKTIIFQLQNSSHQNQEIYGVKTQDFFIPICGKLCEDCCFEKESKNHKKSKGKKRKNSSTQNMAEDNNENLEENSSKKKRKIIKEKANDKVTIGNVSKPKPPNKADEIPMIIPDKDKHIPLQILRNLDGKICKYCDYDGPVRFDTIRHIRNIHLRLKIFQCNECDYGNPKLSTLKDHYKTNHWNKKITNYLVNVNKQKLTSGQNVSKEPNSGQNATKSFIPEKDVELKNFPEEEEDVQKEPEQIPKSISSDNPQNFDKELSSILVKNKEENSKEHQIDDNDSEKSIPNEDDIELLKPAEDSPEEIKRQDFENSRQSTTTIVEEIVTDNLTEKPEPPEEIMNEDLLENPRQNTSIVLEENVTTENLTEKVEMKNEIEGQKPCTVQNDTDTKSTKDEKETNVNKELRENVNKEITSGQNDDEKKIVEENTEINEDAASTETINPKEVPKDFRICKICNIFMCHWRAISSHQKACEKKNAGKTEDKDMENSNSKKTTVEKSGGHSRRNLRRTKRSTAIVEQSDSEDSENIYPKNHKTTRRSSRIPQRNAMAEPLETITEINNIDLNQKANTEQKDLSHIEEKEIEGKIDITGKNIPKLLDLVPDSKKTDENNIHTDENTKDSKTKHSDEKNHDDFEKESKNIVKLHEQHCELSKMDPKDRFIKELLDVHGKEEKNPEHVPQWWDHPAQKNPMLIHMSWEQIRKIVLNLFPQIAPDLAQNPDDSLQDMLNFDQVAEESGITTEIVFRYFHLLEKATSKNKTFKSIRPDSLCTIPIKRGQADHKLAMSDFEEMFPEKDLKDYKLIFGVVIMEIDGEIPHFSLLVIDNVKRELKNYCSLQEKLDTSKLRTYLKKTVKSQYSHEDVIIENYQEGSYDCGLFVCQNAKQIVFNLSNDHITQENMDVIRKMMFIELMKNILLKWE